MSVPPNKRLGTMKFLQAYFRSPLKIGAILPSSKQLAEAMLKNLSLTPGDQILEFGPGTGAFTEVIQRILPPGTHYLGIEREPQFVKLLKNHFPHLHFQHGTAEHALKFCEEYGFHAVKIIISGLPFASLSRHIQLNIIDNINQLLCKEGSVFRTFQYAHAYTMPNALKFRKQMSQLFGDFERSPLLLANLPPAYVLTWRR